MKKLAALFGCLFSVAVLVTACFSLNTGAQWKASAPQLEAVGTVQEIVTDIQMPHGPKGQSASYIYVEFMTTSRVHFVIPFRSLDMLALQVDVPALEVPESEEYTNVGSSGSCSSDASFCTTAVTSYTKKKRVKAYTKPGVSGYGLLRYHQCEGYLYCFDSFTELVKP